MLEYLACVAHVLDERETEGLCARRERDRELMHSKGERQRKRELICVNVH